MVESNAPEDILNVPVEATAFLAAVSAFAVLLLVIFLYVNKKWRILNVGFPSSRPPGSRNAPILVKQHQHEILPKRLSPFRSTLGESYVISAPESSSDSEEDVLRRLRHQMSLQHEDVHDRVVLARGSPLITSAVRSVSVDHATSHYNHHNHHHHPHSLIQQRSFDLSNHPLHQSTPSSSNAVVPASNHQQHHHASSSSSAYTSVRPLRVSGFRDRDIEEVSCTSSSRRRTKGLMGSSSMGGRSGADGGDLMSLAERGKVNGGSSASSTSSNVSADDDGHHHHLQHHHPHQGVIMRNHPIRMENSRPVSVSSTATTLVATPQPHSSIQSPPLQSHTHHSSSSQQMSTHLAQHSAPCSNPNFRRMLPPRTKSIDSESPPPSEQGLSTYGDSIADQDDHIFEVEEMSIVEGDLGDSARGASSPIQCGSLEVAFDYEAAARKMTVHVIQVRGVPHKDMGGANNTQIRLVLLPDRKQKNKTKVRPGENPSFMEAFVFNKINPEDVSSLGVRFRLYGCERMRRERLLGECILGFGSLHLEIETTTWLNFEPRYHLSWDSKSESGSLARSDSASSTTSIQSGIPELLVGLAYNGTTGRLTVEIIKGSHFRQLAGGSRAPDSYVKIVLVSCTDQEMGRAKTSLRRAQSNPLFKETFMFQVALFQIQEVTLLVSVYGRKGVTRRELLGWFALGYNSSGDEETTHWEDMCDAQGDQMCRWHVIQS